jgi:radical SAM protein with 4Fe4S-binding SPASM domain
MLLSTNGTALDPSLVRALKKAGIKRLSLSLDGHDAASHDAFRGVRGAFASLKRSARLLVEGDLPFQINSTVTAGNLKDLVAIQDLAFSLGAVAHHIFLLVPVGRAKDWDEAPLEPQDYENALLLLKDREISLQLEIKATCAPQYQRISREKGQVSARSGRGCLGGQGFLFISHDGIAQACGYLPLPAGNVRAEPLREIYQNSPLFGDLRDRARYRGKCGLCEYFKVCGGCRARAHAQGDCLGPEPLCPHLPQALRRSPDVAP